VTYLLTVQVSDALRYLSEEMNDQFLRKYSFGTLILNILIEADSTNVLLDQVDLFGCLEAIDQLDSVWMLELLHALDFSHYGFLLVWIIKLVLRVDFHRHFFLS
jgi:hypothetical protein